MNFGVDTQKQKKQLYNTQQVQLEKDEEMLTHNQVSCQSE